jgi:TatD DNase family protein
MYIIDTHSHLYVDQFLNDIGVVIQNARSEGVQKIFLPNIDSSSIESMLNLTRQYNGICHAMMGLHPTSVKKNFEKELEIVQQFLDKKTSVFTGIGEIGLDLYWDKTFLEEQKIAFAQQIKWAKTYHLPIIIHGRNSYPEIFKVLEDQYFTSLTGIFHCFSGSLTDAQQAIDMGFKLGIGGVLTYPTSGLDKIVEEIELEHLVLETDAPWLTPVPFRGKRNESAYILYTARKLAEIKKVPLETVADITSRNALAIFGQISPEIIVEK